ncbi:MAG: STAS/SEC14 domain-containing protein [Gemmatimonadota bacterium]|jgi:hypothetical protein
MLELRTKPDLIEILVRGTLEAADYDRLVPELERLAAERGALRVYIELSDFGGWEPEGLWRELKFDATHQDDLDRVAIVGEKAWEEWGTKLSKPFFKAETRYFTRGQEDRARAWLRSE